MRDGRRRRRGIDHSDSAVHAQDRWMRDCWFRRMAVAWPFDRSEPRWTPMSISHHEFGGESTDLKLQVVEGYLRAFTRALRPHFQRLWYVDAFAGTGERTERHKAVDKTLFDPATPERVQRHRGSAKRAIEVEPHFDRLIFIEKNPKHCAALNSLKGKYPDRDIQIRNGSADEEIRGLLAAQTWASTRVVMFLDPYGMSVPWETMELIARSQAIDLWYLVSLSGIFRQAARDRTRISAGSRSAITRMLGTAKWETEWYTRSEEKDLFGGIDEHDQRIADVKKIENFVEKRLKTIFPDVLPPLRLKNSRGAPIFDLFFAISNPDHKAIGLARKIARHMLEQGRSSHERPR